MKTILLDENMSYLLKGYFPADYEIRTARWMGWHGKQNGELLRLAAEADFDAVVTLDKSMEFEQNPQDLPVAVIVLSPPRNIAKRATETIDNIHPP